MIIRATRKLINLSRVEARRDERPLPEELPGEWYASGVSQSRRSVVHYLHVPSLVSVVVEGRSLKTTSGKVAERLERLLQRHGYAELINRFALSSPPVILTTNSRRILGYLNQMRYLVEYHLALPEAADTLDLDHLEDVCFDYLFTVGGKTGQYTQPGKELNRYQS